MKQYSSFRMFIEYIAIAFSIYFIFSFFISFIGDYPYREILSHPVQLGAIMFLYWWPPIFRLSDMETHNKTINQQ